MRLLRSDKFRLLDGNLDPAPPLPIRSGFFFWHTETAANAVSGEAVLLYKKSATDSQFWRRKPN